MNELSGFAYKQGEKGLVKSWKKRWLVLKDNQVFYYKSVNDKLPKGVISLCTATNVALVANNFGRKSGCGLQINSPKRDWHLILESDEVAEMWVARLNEVRLGRSRTDLITQYDSFSKEELIALLIDKDNELMSCKKELTDIKQSSKPKSANYTPSEVSTLSLPLSARSASTITFDTSQEIKASKPSGLSRSISNLARLKL